MAARLAPYLRYYSTTRPLDDHGATPAVLVVFEDPVAPAHFVRLARDEMARTRVNAPLWVSSAEALDAAGPLSEVWRSPGAPEPTCAFA